MPFDLLFLSLCVVLTTLSNSQQCAPSYSFNSQRCISCQQNCICKTEHTCDSCIAGATFDVLFKQCLQCPPYVDPTNVGCLECCPQVTGTAFVCSSCPTGSDIYLIGGQCISKKGCSNITDNGSCTACFASYYIALGSCIPCHISCASCNYQTLCLTCALGYYNASNVDYSLCQSCPVNCASCSTASTCTNCSAGYYLSTSTCLACSQNCLQCTGPSCTTCNSQSGLISGVCQLCSTGCISCTSDSVSVHCTACSGGYYLNANTRSCVSCASTFPNSILCSQTGAQQCSQDSNPTLTARYYLMSGSCVQNIHSCKDMLDSLGNCATCYFDSLVGFYTLTSGSCVRCNVNGCSNYSSICQCL